MHGSLHVSRRNRVRYIDHLLVCRSSRNVESMLTEAYSCSSAERHEFVRFVCFVEVNCDREAGLD